MKLNMRSQWTQELLTLLVHCFAFINSEVRQLMGLGRVVSHMQGGI